MAKSQGKVISSHTQDSFSGVNKVNPAITNQKSLQGIGNLNPANSPGNTSTTTNTGTNAGTNSGGNANQGNSGGKK